MSSFIKFPNVLSSRTDCAEPCCSTPSSCTCEKRSLPQRYNRESLLQSKLLAEAKFMID